MSDYIKREDAIKSIIRNDHTDVSKAFKRMFAEEMLSYVKDKDVVSIVRCNECKHWDEHSQYGYDSEHGVYGNYCMLWTPEDDFYAVETPENGFCYNGERRDDETNRR